MYYLLIIVQILNSTIFCIKMVNFYLLYFFSKYNFIFEFFYIKDVEYENYILLSWSFKNFLD